MTENELVDGIAVHIQSEDGRAVLTLVGELDLVSAPRLRSEIGALRSDDIEEVVVDLCGLTYIDSVGIGLLVATRRRLDAEGRKFCVRNPTPQVLRLLEITGLVEYLGLR
ncbi:MAG TPA: STAS domain-containing protein [Acidimicrobiales bacterium]